MQHASESRVALRHASHGIRASPRAPLPARRVIAGDFATPLFTSGRRFDGIVIELFRAAGIDALLQCDVHVVGVHVRGRATLTQVRDGRLHREPVRAGNVIVTPAGAPKRWQCEEEREWITLRLDPAVVDRVAAHGTAADAPPRLVDRFGARDTAIESLAHRLLDEARAPGLAADAYVDAMTHELAVHLLRRHSTASPREAGGQRLPDHKLRRVREYVDTNLAETLTVRGIAGAIAMSPHHFAHVFAQTTGQTPHRFVVERRLERAKWLLASTETPVIDVAHEIGCRSQAHFAVLFRRETGMAPTAYRRHYGR